MLDMSLCLVLFYLSLDKITQNFEDLKFLIDFQKMSIKIQRNYSLYFDKNSCLDLDFFLIYKNIADKIFENN